MVWITCPLQGIERHLLPVPRGWHVRMSQIKQLALLCGRLEPDRLGNVGNRIAATGPRSEDTDLRLALRPNGAVAKANARMTPTGIGEDEKRIFRLRLASLRRVNSE